MDTTVAPAATNNPSYVLACNKIDSMAQKQLTKVELQTFNCTVQELVDKICQLFSVDKDTFNLVCFGKTLDLSKSLESYGINNGVILYLTKKTEAPFKRPVDPSQRNSADDAFSTESQQMCIALKSALLDPHFRKVLESLSDFEKRENIMAITPELRSDPTLFGILSDPDLLGTYINRNNIKKVLQRYPYFLEVATHISATFHEESRSGSTFNMDSIDRSAFLNYSIDAPSDEEMDESETSSVSSTNTQQSASSSRLAEHPNQSFSSMLMRAYQTRNQGGQSSSSASSSLITQDMLRQALNTSATFLQAPSATQTSTQSTAPAAPPPPPASSSVSNEAVTPAASQPATEAAQPRTTAQILIGWAPQLRQMRELGITDDIVAIQALEATNGDVQAAINIIFSDFN